MGPEAPFATILNQTTRPTQPPRLNKLPRLDKLRKGVILKKWAEDPNYYDTKPSDSINPSTTTKQTSATRQAQKRSYIKKWAEGPNYYDTKPSDSTNPATTTKQTPATGQA